MNNKNLKTGVKTREISIDGVKRILVSSPHDAIKRKKLTGRIIDTMLYIVCGIFTVVLGYFIGKLFNI